MSTTTLTYPNTIPVRHVAGARSVILITAISALIAGAIVLAAFSATIDTSSSAAPSGVVAVAVPPAPVTSVQGSPIEPATPAPGADVIAVPVPTPPSE